MNPTVTPKYIENFPLDDLTPQQYIALATITVRKLSWELGYLSAKGIVAYTNNGSASWNCEILITLEDGISTIKSVSTGNETIDLGKNNREAVMQFTTAFNELKATLSKEELDAKYREMEELLSSNDDMLNTSPPTEDKRGFLSYFIPVEGYFITPILIALNIILYVVMVVSGVHFLEPDIESLLTWGGNFRALTLGGEYYRLLTACFIHIGIIHIAMNMYALLYVGVLLEPILGKSRFLAAYLLTGIAASVTSIAWHDNTVSAGASGAIFGMYGLFLALLTTSIIEKSVRQSMLSSIGIFVGYNLIFGMRGGVDNAAHIGGLVSGILIGYAFVPSLRKPHESRLKFGSIAVIGIAIISFSAFACTKIPNDLAIYDKKMDEFMVFQEKALELHSLPETTPDQEILRVINEKGIYNWKQGIDLVKSMNELDIPLELRTRNRLMIEYCELRIKFCELLYKTISENTDIYNPEMEKINKEIEERIRILEAQEPLN